MRRNIWVVWVHLCNHFRKRFKRKAIKAKVYAWKHWAYWEWLISDISINNMAITVLIYRINLNKEKSVHRFNSRLCFLLSVFLTPALSLFFSLKYSCVCIHISSYIHEILLNQSMRSKWMDNLFNIRWDQASLMKITILTDEWLSSSNEIMGWKAKELF